MEFKFVFRKLFAIMFVICDKRLSNGFTKKFSNTLKAFHDHKK